MLRRIIEILLKSKEEKVDIGVAYDMLKTENKDKDYTKAFETLRNNQEEIGTAWNAFKEACKE